MRPGGRPIYIDLPVDVITFIAGRDEWLQAPPPRRRNRPIALERRTSASYCGLRTNSGSFAIIGRDPAALRSHSASKSLSASVVAGIEPHHPAAIPPIVSCHSATAASHRALETRLCPSRCRQKGEGDHGRGICRGCHRYYQRHDGRDLSDVAARLTRSGSFATFAAMRRASSRGKYLRTKAAQTGPP